MGDYPDLSRLSITLEVIGLVLAWGETRKPFWFVRLEKNIDKISKANLGDVISLLPMVLEPVVLVFLVFFILVFGQSFESDEFKYLYGAVLLLVLVAPFVVKRMKALSGGNAIATLGLVITLLGVVVQVLQWL